MSANGGGGDVVQVDQQVLPASEIRRRVQGIQQVMASVMQDGVHYGTIPGTDRPCLWQPGAEKLAMAFGITLRTEVIDERVTEEEVCYRVRATATSATGQDLGSTEGVCSTREKKFRWRRPVHSREFEATPEHLRRVTYTRDGEDLLQVRTEPGDLLNTILRMAAKRATVALVRSVTAASDVFAQELEHDDIRDEPPVRQPNAAPPSALGKAAQDGALRVTAARKLKAGAGKSGPWTLYGVTLSDGREAATFSDSVFAAAQAAQRSGHPVTVTIEPGRNEGQSNLVSVEVVG
jgi:hypothetical protein